MSTKMEWYVEALLKGQREFNIKKSGRKFGTVCLPTGAGKSAIIFDDMLRTIEENKNKKVIINLVSPIIKLKNQTVEDFISIISNDDIRAYYDAKGIDVRKVAFYNCSSDDHEYGTIDDEYDGKKLDKLPTETNRIIIIDNCLKSFPKSIKALSDLDRKNTYIVTYLDESHKLTTDKAFEGNDEADCEYIDIKKLGKISDSIIAISATPHTDLTVVLNEMAGIKCTDDWDYVKQFIYYMSPRECIEAGMIVKPNFCISTQRGGNDGSLDINTCISAMNEAKAKLPNIAHKVLVNCRDIKQVDELYEALKNAGCVVFATHSKTNDPEITAKVDNYEGDCFVLHVRQLIAGIDINSLTDCIIPIFGYDSLYKESVIQTIGRCMRSAKGERGFITSKRTKPYCNVYFVTDSDSYDTAYTNAYYFLVRYYEVGMIDFHSASCKLAKGDHEEFEMDKKHKTLIAGVYDSINNLVTTPKKSAINFYRQFRNMNELFLAKQIRLIFENAGMSISDTTMSSENKNLLLSGMLCAIPEGATKEEWKEIKRLARMNIKKIA